MLGQSPQCNIPNFVEIGSPVPEKKIFMVFTIYGHGGQLGHVTWTININFRSPFLRMIHMKIGFDWPSGFRGEVLRNCGLTDDGGRTTEHGHPICSPYEPSAQVSQKQSGDKLNKTTLLFQYLR